MKKNQKVKYQSEEQKEVKKFIVVVLGLVIIIVGIYFFTKAFITKDLFEKENETNYTDGAINYNVAIVGNMLNRPYSEYYVIAFDSKDNEAGYYSSIVSKYSTGENSLKIYTIDLANELNKNYIAEEGKESKEFTSIDDLKLGKITLLKIKNKKVTNFITNIEDIKKELTTES